MPDWTPELIKRSLAGDGRLVRSLVDALVPVIQAKAAKALMRRSGPSGNRDVRQEVGDLTQAVFTALFADRGRVLRSWDPARGELEMFVRIVAEREVASILRTQRRSPWTEDPTLSETLEDQPAREDDIEAVLGSRELLDALLQRVRARVSDRGWEIFDLLLVDGRSVEDVGQAMNMTPEAVYAWRSRLARLAREVAAELLSEKRGS